ncbi:MAG: HNH endonuclease [Rhodococcus sp.]|nr:HNH endonuclease [Rhodococcus sp. (in: high G+C Gram-positive bacteria)]
MSGDTTGGLCIPYVGTINADGYGVLPKAVHGSRLAHRAALAEKLGRPVNGVTRHACDNPPCVNPDHLLEGTQADNMADMSSRSRGAGRFTSVTHCINGHEFTAENTRIKRTARRGNVDERSCRICNRSRSAKANAKRATRNVGVCNV